MEIMRQCWSGEPVTHHGERYHYDGVKVRPVPKQLDVWLGGFAPSELKRVGRFGDGWLPSFVTPQEAADGRVVVEQVAAEHEREIEEDHYGVLIPYSLGEPPEVLLAQLARRRPDIDPAELVPRSWDELRRLIGRFIEVGTTKFVVLPVIEPQTTDEWSSHLETAAAELLGLEN
jgi:probable F420-dependent oxidoreductase